MVRRLVGCEVCNRRPPLGFSWYAIALAARFSRGPQQPSAALLPYRQRGADLVSHYHRGDGHRPAVLTMSGGKPLTFPVAGPTCRLTPVGAPPSFGPPSVRVAANAAL